MPGREGGSSEDDFRPPDEGVGADGEEVEEEGETDTCVICCEQVTALSLTGCGHDHVCARCCLRLRMLYKVRTKQKLGFARQLGRVMRLIRQD
jgi:hypothetical protein